MAEEQAHEPTDLAQESDTPGYSRVSPEKAALIARLKRLNPKATLQEIADVVGYSVPTVSRWLTALNDNTVIDARNLMKAQALPAAMRIVDQIDHDDPRVSQGAAKAVMAAAGVVESGPTVSVGVQVIVGSSEHPAGPDPFEVNVIDSK